MVRFMFIKPFIMKNKRNEFKNEKIKFSITQLLQPNLLSDSWNDEIFKPYNKSYGAYELRHEYGFTIYKALLISFSSVIIFFMATYLVNRSKPSVIINEFLPVLIEPENFEFPTNEKSKPKLCNLKKTDKSLFALTVDSTFDNQKAISKLNDTSSGTGTDTTGNYKKGNSKIAGSNVAGDKKLVETPKDSAVSWVPQMPEFPGGPEALNKFISKNIKTNLQWRENGNEGKVIYEFVIGKDGTVRNQKIILDGVKYGVAELNLELFEKMPTWNPGKNNGHEVSVLLHLPIKLVKE